MWAQHMEYRVVQLSSGVAGENDANCVLGSDFNGDVVHHSMIAGTHRTHRDSGSRWGAIIFKPLINSGK